MISLDSAFHKSQLHILVLNSLLFSSTFIIFFLGHTLNSFLCLAAIIFILFIINRYFIFTKNPSKIVDKPIQEFYNQDYKIVIYQSNNFLKETTELIVKQERVIFAGIKLDKIIYQKPEMSLESAKCRWFDEHNLLCNFVYDSAQPHRESQEFALKKFVYL